MPSGSKWFAKKVKAIVVQADVPLTPTEVRRRINSDGSDYTYDRVNHSLIRLAERGEIISEKDGVYRALPVGNEMVVPEAKKPVILTLAEFLEKKPEDEDRKPELSGPVRFGNWYWCIKTPLAEKGAIYAYADEVRVDPVGTLFLKRRDGLVNLALAAGQWTILYAASCLDGSAVAVEHWEGEVVR